MGTRVQKTHRLILVGNPDGSIGIECERGDLNKWLGFTPTPDEVAREANAHWGTALPVVR